MKILRKKSALLLISIFLIHFGAIAQISGLTTVCAGQTETYSSVGSASNYQWTITGAKSYTASGSSVTIEWGAGGTGNVGLQTFNQNNTQTGNYIYSVNINSKPNPAIQSSFSSVCSVNDEGTNDSCFLACQFQPVIYSAPSSAGVNYTWEIIGSGTMTTLSANSIEVVWQNLGIQYVKLTASSGVGCSNQLQHCVRVIESPLAMIGTNQGNVSQITVCKDAPIFLTDLSTGSIGRRWDFGDGTASDKINPTHSYSTAGTYQIVLTANNACFCLDTDTLTVVVNDAEGAEIVCPSVVCEGDTFSYSTPSSCGNFKWSAANGIIIGSDSGNTVDIVWSNHPAFIQLDATNCNTSCNAPTVEKISVLTDSIPIQGANPACNKDVNIYSISPIEGSVYTWTVDGSLGRKIEDNGYYIKVEIDGLGGYIRVNYFNPVLGCSGSSEIYVSAKPRMNFAMPSEVCENDTVLYDIDFPVDWTIEDSTGQVVFTDLNATETTIDWTTIGGGNYTLKLGKLNSYCNDLIAPFTVLAAPISPDTIYGSNNICTSDAYTYSADPRTGYVVEWLVQGGTPEVAVGNSITVNWSGTAPFIVKAAYRQLASPNCLSYYTEKTLASATNGTPTINGTDSICGGDTATFALSFVADDVEWFVIPNDGASILTNRFGNDINVQFSAAITQTITLRAIGSICNNPFTLDHTVFIETFDAPSVSFSDPNPCPDVPVQFFTNSRNPSWEIDGLRYSGLSPIVTFDSAKTISVKVTSTNTGAMGCIVERVNIAQLIVKAAPKASISVLDSNLNHCYDTLYPIFMSAALQGANSSSYNHQWLKDGNPITGFANTYTTPIVNAHGVYTVEITAPNGCVSTSEPVRIDTCSSTSGCRDIRADTNITVDIILGSSSCSDYFVQNVIVGGGATFLDIRFVSTNLVATDVGAYNIGVNLKAGTHSLRFEGSVVQGMDTLCFTSIVQVTVDVEPDFKIVKDPCNTTGTQTYTLLNTTTYAGIQPTSSWNYGGGTVISSGYNPKVLYTAGTYSITLTYSGGCSITKQLTVDPPTNANFVSSAPSCQQEPVDFANLSSGNIIEYQWDFGGQVLYKENPSVTFVHFQNDYTRNFNQTVTLSVLDAVGCRSNYSQLISIRGNQFDGRVLPLSPSAVCDGDSITLFYNQANPFSNTPITYSWSNLESTPIIYAKQTGNYKLNLVDNVGCRFVSKQVNVQVNIATNPTIIGKQTFCADDTVRLNILNHPSYDVSWTINNTYTGQTAYNFKDYLPAGNYMIGTNITNVISGCPSTSSPFPVTVLAGLAKPSITTSNSYPLCEGSPITLNANPAGSSFYWNTGQTGNSIIQSLGGRYTVFQTDISGCQSSQYIDINPLPDFSNFMTGCYCLPSSNTPDLLGIPNMASYQWVKDGQNVPLPMGGLQNLPASAGSFDLIAVTDSGCVDTAGTLDISIDGCEDCILDLSNFEVNCSRTNGDSIFYDFSVKADLNNGTAFYQLNHNIFVDGSPATILQVQPNTISGSRNTIIGSFYTVSSSSSDSLCISLTASNPGVNCTAELCIAVEDLACDVVPNFNYTANPFTCNVDLIQSSSFGSCTSSDSVIYSWTVTQNRISISGVGESFSFDSLDAGLATVCMQMQIFNSSDSSFCIKDTCKTITIPDCSCNNNCENLTIDTAEFVQFIQRGDSCILEFQVTINNPQNVVVYVNHLKSNSGKILSIVPARSGFNQVSYLVRYYPDQPWNGGSKCFDLYLNNGGANCCLNFCVKLPKCECNLRLPSLKLSCSGAGSPNGWYDFSLTVDLRGSDCFDYDVSELGATLGGKNVKIITQSLVDVVNGVQVIKGTIDVSGAFGNPICMSLTANLGGVECSDTICVDLPKVPCNIAPSFSSSFDDTKCVLTLTNTSTTNPCSRIDTSKLKWEVTYGGVTYIEYGQVVQFFNASGTDITICLTVEATDFAGVNFCTEQFCEVISITDCRCEEPCDNIVVTSTVFDKILPTNDSCIFRFQVTVEDLNGSPFNLNSIIAHNGTVLATRLLHSSGSKNTYEVDFYPNQPWTGGIACFNVFVTTHEGEICCTEFCILLPKCDCDFYLDPFTLNCTAPNGTLGDFTFSIPVGLDGTVGFNYSMTITATLNGTPVNINSYQPSTLVHGSQTVTGLISLPQGQAGDILCFTITATLNGRSCFASICGALPPNPCDIVEDFTWSIDPQTCDVIFTNTSVVGSCTYIDPTTVKWSFRPQGGSLSYAGGEVVNYGQFSGNIIVCMDILGFNWTGDQDCHPSICKTLFIPRCPEEGDYEDGEKEEFNFERRASKSLISGEDISVYPNPAKSLITVEWNNSIEEEVSLTLKDHQSKIVWSEDRSVSGRKVDVDLSGYADGIYILEISWKDNITRKKIVILK